MMNDAIEYTAKNLTHPYYYGVVVGTSVDVGRTGAVQASIIGVTDLWEDKLQPWIYPQLMQGMVQVPQKGHWILIRFNDGDINQGLYYAISPTKNFTPEQYMEGYPDIAIMNLGETGYLYTHNRMTHTSTIDNPGNGATLTWNETGNISLESANYAQESGRGTVPVLTECTIDVFTCKPIGSPDTGIRAGSEYLSVPHITQQSIDTLRGNVTAEVKPAESTAEEYGDAQETRDIIGVVSSYGIPFMESPAAIRRTGKECKRILIGSTISRPLAEYLSMYCDTSAKECVHYLVGVGDGDPDILSSLDSDAKPQNLGFIQCAELSSDTTFGGDMVGKLNLDAVTVMFYGDGNLNEYQQAKLNDIVQTVKAEFKLVSVDVVAYKPARPTAEMTSSSTAMLAYEGEY